MDSTTYFLNAIQSGAYLKKRWVFEAFARTSRTTINECKEEPFDYQLFLLKSDEKELGYYDPATKTVLPLSQQKEPLLSLSDRIILKSGDLPNVTNEIDTNFGNVFVNMVLLCRPFGNKIPFMTGKISSNPIEKQIVKTLSRRPENKEDEKPDVFYIDELLKYQEGLLYVDQFASICVPSQSVKSTTQNPNLVALKNKLVKENEGKLDDLTVLADIESQLVALDRENLKGDPAERALLSKKVFDVSRKKKFGIYGLEEGFGISTIITRSLNEGFDPDLMPAYANAARSGSYNRGAQTAFGGVEVKRANRAFKEVKIVEEDCGSKGTIPRHVTNINDLVGRYMIEPSSKKPIKLTEEMLKGQEGSVIFIRSPLLCKTSGLNRCKTCCGERLSMLPDGIHVQVSMIGSILMNCFMKAMHGKSLSTKRYDYRLRIQ